MNFVWGFLKSTRRVAVNLGHSPKGLLVCCLLWFALPAPMRGGGVEGPTGKKHKQSKDGKTADTGVLGPAPKAATTGKPETEPEIVPGRDYVPCKFTLAELRMLQKPEIAQTLSPADVQALQSRVVDAALRENSDPSLSGPALTDLVIALGSATTSQSLIGLTPSQALANVMDIVRKNRDKTVTTQDLEWYVSIIRGAVDQPTEGNSGAAGQPTGASTGGKIVTAETFLSSIEAQQSTEKRDAAGTNSTVQAVAEEIERLGPPLMRSRLYSKVNELVDKSNLPLGTKSLVLGALFKGKPLDSKDLIDAARKYLDTLERPQDIGCSMSLLTWREVQYAFGYLIANEYIAVQVVVRNLNQTEQFVMHDVEFEVDADPTGRLGRFYSGRDKIVVRALANTQSTGDPRNITMSIASGIGQLMGAAELVYGGALKDAAGVYTGAFIPGLQKGWKDLSGDQLKMIDDYTFSSAPSSQTVVPKSGTVVFYTFIPSKQFEEGWWTQPCVEKTYEGTLDQGGRLTNLSRGTYGQQTPTGPAGSSIAEVPSGVDVRRALEVCARVENSLPRQHSRWGTLWSRGILQKTKEDDTLLKVPDPTAYPVPTPPAGSGNGGKDKAGPTAGQAGDDSPSPSEKTGADATKPVGHKPDDTSVEMGFDLYRNAYKNPYRRWSGNSLAIFRELANTVVAGAHIIEDNDLLPSVLSLDCGNQVDSKGTVDFSKVKDGSLTCTLTGKNLDKLVSVRLRNAADPVDPKTADSKVVVVGDSTKATVSWKVADLHALPGTDYLLFGVTGNGAEQKTSTAVHLGDGPAVTEVVNSTASGTTFDFTSLQTAQILTVTGYRLDQVTGVVLTPAVNTDKADADAAKADETAKAADSQVSSSRKAVTVKTLSAGSTQVTFSLDNASLTSLGDGGATLTLKTSDSSKSKELGTDFGITVKLATKKAAVKRQARKPAPTGAGHTPAHR